MSYRLEQTVEELDYLIGATIERIEVRPDCMGEESLNLVLKAKGPVGDQHGNLSDRIEVQVWMDSEGNGPGYLALTAVGDARGDAEPTPTPPLPRSGAEARAMGRVEEYAAGMKQSLIGLGQSEQEAEAARVSIIARFGSPVKS